MTRLEAYRAFDNFADGAQLFFGKLRIADRRARELEKRYSFYAIKGGSAGGLDKRLVEVFFGQRPFDEITIIGSNDRGFPAPRTSLVAEQGACLRYQRNDVGAVVCTLHPATTANLRQREDFIRYAVVLDPSRLLSQRVLRKHWRAFISYMECTGIDGEPTVIDRLRISWLRCSRPLYVGARLRRTNLSTAATKIVTYALTIGLSGFLLAIVNHYIEATDAKVLSESIGPLQTEIRRACELVQGQSEQVRDLAKKVAQLENELLQSYAPHVCGPGASENANGPP